MIKITILAQLMDMSIFSQLMVTPQPLELTAVNENILMDNGSRKKKLFQKPASPVVSRGELVHTYKESDLKMVFTKVF